MKEIDDLTKIDHEIDFDFSNEDDQDFIPDNHSGKDEAEDYDEL